MQQLFKMQLVALCIFNATCKHVCTRLTPGTYMYMYVCMCTHACACRWLKTPPMAHVNLMTMRDGNGWVNCGVVYAQNAAPDGPTAYMLGDIITRSLRWDGRSYTVPDRLVCNQSCRVTLPVILPDARCINQEPCTQVRKILYMYLRL